MSSTAARKGTARLVGSAIKRREDPRLMTGFGIYVDDMTLPGMAEMV